MKHLAQAIAELPDQIPLADAALAVEHLDGLRVGGLCGDYENPRDKAGPHLI